MSDELPRTVSHKEETREECIKTKLFGTEELRDFLTRRSERGDYDAVVRYGIRKERLGSFQVSYQRQNNEGFPRSSIVGDDGAAIALHRQKHSSAGAPSFEAWIYRRHPMKFESADEILHDCVFIVEEKSESHFPTPEEAGAKTEKELVHEDHAAEADNNSTPIDTPEHRQGKKSKKIKGARKPASKKKSRAEIKERDKRNAERDYQTTLAALEDAAHAFDDMHGEKAMARAMDAFVDMALFLSHSNNQVFRKRFVRSLTTEGKYENLRRLLGLFYVIEGDRFQDMLHASSNTRAYGEETMRMINAQRQIGKLAQEVANLQGKADAFRSREARENTNATGQSLMEYGNLLFPEFKTEIEFLTYLASRPKERWIDVGNGENYFHPGSLMNEMPFINPNVSIVGVDLLYRKGAANFMDKIYGRDELIESYAKQHELVGVAAQELSTAFPPESFDAYLSCLTYDKFNTENGGIEQALRQAAYVVKPGGRIRIYPFPVDRVPPDHPIIRKYFDVIGTAEVAHSHKEELVRTGLALTRKRVSEEDMTELKREIDEWLKRHVQNGAL